MRLAVFGQTPQLKQLLLQRAKSVGFDVNLLENASPEDEDDNRAVRRTLSRAHAALYILKNPSGTLDDRSHHLLDQIITSMKSSYIQRLVVFSCLDDEAPKNEQLKQASFLKRLLGKGTARPNASSPPAPTALDVLEQSGLDWTLVGCPCATTSLAKDMLAGKPSAEKLGQKLAKCLVSQVTDARYVRGTYVFNA